MKKKPILIECFMCGVNVRQSCSLCQGTGGLEATHKKSLDKNEVEHTGKMGKSGHPKIFIPIMPEPALPKSPRTVLSLNEWVSKYAEKLGRDIETHLLDGKVFDASGLKRMIMTSVRQWYEDEKA